MPGPSEKYVPCIFCDSNRHKSENHPEGDRTNSPRLPADPWAAAAGGGGWHREPGVRQLSDVVPELSEDVGRDLHRHLVRRGGLHGLGGGGGEPGAARKGSEDPMALPAGCQGNGV